MKLTSNFKIIFYVSLVGLFLSGLLVWIFGGWFQINEGLGPEPRPERIWYIRSHAVFGLWFLSLFGYLFHSHILKGLKAKRKIASGLTLFLPLVILCLTVPGLYYLTDDGLKDWVARVHTYLGIAIVLPFFIHWLTPSHSHLRSRISLRRRFAARR